MREIRHQILPILDAVTLQPTGRFINPIQALYQGLLTLHNGTVMATIADIDQPRQGIISVSQEPLLQQLSSMKP